MLTIPDLPTETLPLLLQFVSTFTRPTFPRFQLLLAAVKRARRPDVALSCLLK